MSFFYKKIFMINFNHFRKKNVIMFFFILFLNIATASENKKNLNSIKNSIVLFSNERSGSNWTKSILEIFFHKGSYRTKDRISCIGIKLEDDPSIFKTHQSSHVNQFNQKKNKLLFVLRNYKECLIKKSFSRAYNNNIPLSYKDSINFALSKNCIVPPYIERIRTYDNWSGEKLLIYYEELITNPEQIIQQIIEFVGEEEKIDPRDFFSNYEQYREIVYNSYHSTVPKNNIKKNIITFFFLK